MAPLAAAAVAGLLAVSGAVTAAAPAAGVWPPPRHIAIDGEPLLLSPEFAAGVVVAAAPAATEQAPPQATSNRLQRAIRRFNALAAPPGMVETRVAAVAAAPTTVPLLGGVDIHVTDSSNESLGTRTDYSYMLRTTNARDQRVRVVVTASSIYGAMYALESLAQLIDVKRGFLAAASVQITDAPAHSWRGLLVDTGRRFAPVPLLENIIDTMAAVKLNVLHLHLSDFCRFGVESKRFPALTAGLGPSSANAGFYSQAEIKQLIAYAADRGVRLVPEIEMPGHALGFLPIASVGGLEFCNTCAYGKTGNGSGTTCVPSQLWGSVGTARVLSEVLGEMAALFSDAVFHIGADETFVKPSAGERCDPNSTAALEKHVVETVAHDFGKTPAGWEQVLFETGAATKDTIVYAYFSLPSRVTATGRRAVVANGTALYFTVAAPAGPTGWSKLWYDIGYDVPQGEKELLLGGEMSMWTDTYCDPRECGAMPNYHAEKGGLLYNRSLDVAYGRSLGGMIWPRGFVGAAAFWNWNASLDPHSDEFAVRIEAVNEALAARGSLVCPNNCSCDQLTACGEPYVGDE